MLLASVALMVAAQLAPAEGGGVAVFLARRNQTSQTAVDGVRAALEKAVSSKAMSLVSGAASPSVCEGRRVCLLELARRLEAKVAVLISMSQVAEDVSIAVDAFRSSDGSKLASLAVVLLSAELEGFDLHAQKFAAELSRALPPPARPPPEAAAVTLGPPKVAEAFAAAPEMPKPPPSRAPSLFAGGSALALAGAGAYFAAAAFGAKAKADARGDTLADGRPTSPLTFSEASAARDSANASATAAVSLGVTSLACAVVAVLFWPAASEEKR
ncbi:MAG: hypothetical protein HYZ28_23630 [Myxococcales bacterium]|nr:hypothetical protein [Myxococcales bacterium]